MDDFNKRTWEEEEEGSGLATESVGASSHKAAKLVAEDGEEQELPRTREVVLRFSSTGQEVPGRVVSRESFGILVKATQDAPPSVRAEDRFWTKFCGVLQPMSRIPVVEVIHAVRAK